MGRRHSASDRPDSESNEAAARKRCPPEYAFQPSNRASSRMHGRRWKNGSARCGRRGDGVRIAVGRVGQMLSSCVLARESSRGILRCATMVHLAHPTSLLYRLQHLEKWCKSGSGGVRYDERRISNNGRLPRCDRRLLHLSAFGSNESSRCLPGCSRRCRTRIRGCDRIGRRFRMRTIDRRL